MGGGLVGVCVTDPFEEEYYAVYGAVADAIVVVLERPDVLSWVVEAMHIYIWKSQSYPTHSLLAFTLTSGSCPGPTRLTLQIGHL